MAPSSRKKHKKDSNDDDDTADATPSSRKKQKKDSNDDNDESTPEGFSVFKRFDKGGPKIYRLWQASEAYGMEPMDEFNTMEGGIQIIDETSVAVYAKFPGTHGSMAGRLDNIPPTKTFRPKTHVTGVMSKLSIDYGTWHGPVRREGGPDDGWSGTTCTIGSNVASVGSNDVSPETPIYVDKIHSLRLEEDQEASDDFPEGYELCPAGTLLLTMFLRDPDVEEYYGTGKAAPVPITFWFHPETDIDKNGGPPPIPGEIMAGIKRLPKSRHAES